MIDGIVINAGGSSYFTNAYVCLRMLRFLGCVLPAEFWIKDESEFHPSMPNALYGLNVTIKRSSDYPNPPKGGYQQKVFSVLHSDFDNILLLDADIVPFVDPTFLFSSNLFKQFGAIFWPDGQFFPKDHMVWRIFKLLPDPSPGFQGGQQLISKSRCKEAIRIANKLNQDSDVWYCKELFYGEQDLWRFAFKMTNTPYHLTKHYAKFYPKHINEFDPTQEKPVLLFQHRCGSKWSLKANEHLDNFFHQFLCFGFIEELRQFFPAWSRTDFSQLLTNK